MCFGELTSFYWVYPGRVLAGRVSVISALMDASLSQQLHQFTLVMLRLSLG